MCEANGMQVFDNTDTHTPQTHTQREYTAHHAYTQYKDTTHVTQYKTHNTNYHITYHTRHTKLTYIRTYTVYHITHNTIVIIHSTAHKMPHTVLWAYFTYVPSVKPRSALRPSMCCSSKSASSMASRITSQVGGWWPLPSIHLASPACTAPSASRGLLQKHDRIVAASSSNPSRMAFPLPEALLLTCFLRSLRWPEWSVKM